MANYNYEYPENIKHFLPESDFTVKRQVGVNDVTITITHKQTGAVGRLICLKNLEKRDLPNETGRDGFQVQLSDPDNARIFNNWVKSLTDEQ